MREHQSRGARTDNADLFSLVIGGYGLLGIILDVEVTAARAQR